MRRIAILGSTGSIGLQTLDVVRRLPERLSVTAIAAASQAELLVTQAKEFQVRAVGLFDESRRDILISGLPKSVEKAFGAAGLEEIAVRPDVDIVVVAVSGSVGTCATIAALMAGKTVALATKEVLVAAGELVCQAAMLGGGRILPIDSEHSALFQCLEGQPRDAVAKLWITASGGPFRGHTRAELSSVTAEAALNHPTWRMGPKVTIDSATLMNKGLETIEARWLFDMPVDQIDIVVHPQSVVHSLVEMNDGSLLAQLGVPDMRVPIQYALLYPERADMDVPRLDPRQMGQLTFEAPDEEIFRCLPLAREASRIGGTMPAVLNAANEAAVDLFLRGTIRFWRFPKQIEAAMDAHSDNLTMLPNLERILESDRWAREFAAAKAMGTFAGV